MRLNDDMSNYDAYIRWLYQDMPAVAEFMIKERKRVLAAVEKEVQSIAQEDEDVQATG